MAIRQIHSIWHDFTKSLGMRSSEAQLLIMMLSLVYWSIGWFVILSFGLTLICGTRNREEKEKAVKTRKREEKTYKDAEKKKKKERRQETILGRKFIMKLIVIIVKKRHDEAINARQNCRVAVYYHQKSASSSSSSVSLSLSSSSSLLSGSSVDRVVSSWRLTHRGEQTTASPKEETC